jgi:hypothetical protein
MAMRVMTTNVLDRPPRTGRHQRGRPQPGQAHLAQPAQPRIDRSVDNREPWRYIDSRVEPNPPDGGTVWIFARVRVPVS